MVKMTLNCTLFEIKVLTFLQPTDEASVNSAACISSLASFEGK